MGSPTHPRAAARSLMAFPTARNSCKKPQASRRSLMGSAIGHCEGKWSNSSSGILSFSIASTAGGISSMAVERSDSEAALGLDSSAAITSSSFPLLSSRTRLALINDSSCMGDTPLLGGVYNKPALLLDQVAVPCLYVRPLQHAILLATVAPYPLREPGASPKRTRSGIFLTKRGKHGAVPTLPLAFIHRSAWKVNSQKLGGQDLAVRRSLALLLAQTRMGIRPCRYNGRKGTREWAGTAERTRTKGRWTKPRVAPRRPQVR